MRTCEYMQCHTGRRNQYCAGHVGVYDQPHMRKSIVPSLLNELFVVCGVFRAACLGAGRGHDSEGTELYFT